MNEAPQMTDKESSRQKSFCVSRRELLSGIASLGIFSGVSLPQALAQKHLIIPGGAFVPLPIALPNFVAGTPSDGEVSIGVTQVITNNLKRSGLFAPIDQEAYIGKIVNIDAPPQFQNWRTISAQALLTGSMTRQADGRLEAKFRLWDVATGQQLAGQQYLTQPENWRRIAHIISDQVYERLTGEKGYFDTRVVFVDETGARHQSPIWNSARAIRGSICSTSRPARARSSAIFPA